MTTPGLVGPGERRLGLGLLPELVGRVVGLEGAVGVGELGERAPRRASGTWARRSSSRSTISARVGLCTRPTERKLEPKRRVASETARVSVAPQIRSMSWRGGAGVGEVVGELVEVREGALDLVLGQRRVAGALDRRARAASALVGRVDDLRVDVERLLQRLEADQLALAVEVGRDHDLVGVLGELADRLDDVLVGRLLDELGVDQLVQVGLLPVRVALGEGGIDARGP